MENEYYYTCKFYNNDFYNNNMIVLHLPREDRYWILGIEIAKKLLGTSLNLECSNLSKALSKAPEKRVFLITKLDHILKKADQDHYKLREVINNLLKSEIKIGILECEGSYTVGVLVLSSENNFKYEEIFDTIAKVLFGGNLFGEGFGEGEEVEKVQSEKKYLLVFDENNIIKSIINNYNNVNEWFVIAQI